MEKYNELIEQRRSIEDDSVDYLFIGYRRGINKFMGISGQHDQTVVIKPAEMFFPEQTCKQQVCSQEFCSYWFS